MVSCFDIVKNCKIVKKSDILKCPGDAGLIDIHNSLSSGVFSVKKDRASGGFIYFGEQVKDGRLACAVGTDQSYDFFIVNSEIEIIDGRQSAEIDSQLFDFQNGGLISVHNYLSSIRTVYSPYF